MQQYILLPGWFFVVIAVPGVVSSVVLFWHLRSERKRDSTPTHNLDTISILVGIGLALTFVIVVGVIAQHYMPYLVCQIR